MILTVTMNPAVDKTVEIDNFKIDSVNRIKNVTLDAAGKGINVSKVVKELGGRTKVFTFLGGKTGEFIEEQLHQNRISLVPIYLDEPTRTNMKIVDHNNKTFTDINESGSRVSPEKLERFKQSLYGYATSRSMIVFSGSLPPGVPEDTYMEMIECFNKIGAKTVLDADREVFKLGIKAGPTIVKPNIHELEEFAGKKINDDNEMIDIASTFFQYGTKVVAISLGSEGALFVTEEGNYRAEGIKVEVKGTVGAGDSMVGALCYGLHKELPITDTIALAVATSAAKVMTQGTKTAPLDLVHSLVKKVKITKV